MSSEEYDWVFDFVMGYLASEEFSSAMLDFVDGACVHFTETEENLLIYSDIHEEYKDHVEILLTSKLSELDVPSNLFVEACAKGRESRGINLAVYNKILAMEDFVAFKKLMLKRRAELELEVLEDEQDSLYCEREDHKLTSHAQETEQMVERALSEMQIMHQRENVSQIELEQAIALSLAMEEERVALAQREGKLLDLHHYCEQEAAPDKFEERFEAKRTLSERISKSNESREVSKAEPRSKNKAEGRSEKELPPIGTRRNPSALQSDFSDKPLPTLAELSQQYDDVRTKREKYKEEQRGAIQGLCKDIELRPEAIEERAKHLREQRDRIIAKKKAQRSQNVHAIQLMASESRPIALVQDSGATDAKTVMHTEAKSIPDGRSSSTPTCDEAYAQRRREVVHTALAQRMKHDLVEAEQHRLLRLQEQQFLELGKKLHEVDRLREANKTREVQLAQALRRQQDQVARNIQRSEASAGRSLNDFTFSEEHD